MPPPPNRRRPASPISPARVVRRPSLARTTAKSPQLFPKVTRRTFKHLPDGVKVQILEHNDKLVSKLKRELGADWTCQIAARNRARSSPGSSRQQTSSSTSQAANASNANANNQTGEPPATPPPQLPATSSNSPPPDDPSRDGSSIPRALWPSPLPLQRTSL